MLLPAFNFRYPFYSDFLVNGTDTKISFVKLLRCYLMIFERIIVMLMRIFESYMIIAFDPNQFLSKTYSNNITATTLIEM